MDKRGPRERAKTGVVLVTCSSPHEVDALARAVAERDGLPVRLGYCADGSESQPQLPSPGEAILGAIEAGWKHVLVLSVSTSSQAMAANRNIIGALRVQYPDVELIDAGCVEDCVDQKGRALRTFGPRRWRWPGHRWRHRHGGPHRDERRIEIILGIIEEHLSPYARGVVGFQRDICLSVLKPGQVAVVHDLLGGREMTGRLATLGFTPGASLTMVQNYGWGPLIVDIRDTRIALGRGEARQVHVVPQGPSADA